MIHLDCTSVCLAYQSALLTTPMILVSVFASLVRFPKWLLILLNITLALGVCYMGYVSSIYPICVHTKFNYFRYRAYKDATEAGMARFRLPWMGELADRWVGDE